jgi:transcriptional regulator with XRE-family HTH domain
MVSQVKGKGGTLKASNSYLFKEKHPLIDVLRTHIQDEKVTYQEIHQKTGVSVGTLVRWFDGTTRRPQATTLNQVANYFGLELNWKNIVRTGDEQRLWVRWRTNKETTWEDWYKS